MAFSGYHLRSDVLQTMKEAAGNYMPDYGNWRVRLSTPQPEDPLDAEKKAQDETVQPQGEEQQSGMMQDSWGEEGKEGTVGEVLTESEAYKTQDFMPDDKWREFIANETPEQKQARYKSEVARGTRAPGTPGTEDTRGGVTRTYDIDPETGEYTNVVDEYYGAPAPEGYTPFPKRSPFYSKYEDNPYADVDKFLASQSNKADINGSIATKDTHDHVKNIVTDLKDNVFFAGGDNMQVKKNKAEASAILGKISNSVKADIGPDGSIKTLHDAYKDNLLSASTTDQEKFIFASLFQMNNVKPAINDDNHLVYPVQMPTGETFPVTSEWINDTTEKRIKPFTIATEFNNSKNNFFESGRAGNEWNPDAVIMNSKKLVDQNPNKLASLLLDDNLFTSEPLVNHILRAKAPNADINPKEFVFNALNNEDTRKELENDFARGLEKIARDSWERGNKKYREENDIQEDISNLNAQQLLAKYGKA